MIRVAAVGDIHMGPDTRGVLRPAFDTLPECADLLLLAGDLTRHGTTDEAQVVADEIRGLGVPVVAVLGNHDHHDDRQDEVSELLRTRARTSWRAGDGPGRRGRARRRGRHQGLRRRVRGGERREFGEPVMKEFVRVSRRCADGLRTALERLAQEDCDVRIALTHYSPCRRRWRESRRRSIRSWGAICWPRRSTRPAPTSPCTGTRTPAASTA